MRNKYNAVKTSVDGIEFASKKEAKRYCELKILEMAGKISSLVLQPVYSFKINGYVVGSYIADFRYLDCEKNLEIVEDVKSVATKTPIYRLKKKLMLAIYSIEIKEV